MAFSWALGGSPSPPAFRRRGPRFFEILGRNESALRRDFACGKMLGRRKSAGALARPRGLPLQKTAAPVGATVLGLESAFLGQGLSGGDGLLLGVGGQSLPTGVPPAGAPIF